jgi:hypothetical protein
MQPLAQKDQPRGQHEGQYKAEAQRGNPGTPGRQRDDADVVAKNRTAFVFEILLLLLG